MRFLHPFFLLPLRLYKGQSDKNISMGNINPNVDGYFNAIHFNDLLEIKADTRLDKTLEPYLKKTFIPFCKWNVSTNTKADEAQSILQKIIERQSGAANGMEMPLSYFLGELIDNIEQHSESKYAYIFSQYLPNEGCIDLCIADEGITIYGSFIRAGKHIDKIKGNEAMALQMANEGVSTKDRPSAENRGYGISVSRNMLVNGLGGAFFMLSGQAFHRHDKRGTDFVNLPEPIGWDGTVILLRIPIRIPNGFNIYKYI